MDNVKFLRNCAVFTHAERLDEIGEMVERIYEEVHQHGLLDAEMEEHFIRTGLSLQEIAECLRYSESEEEL